MSERMTAPSKRAVAAFLLIVAAATGGSLAHWRARTVAVQAGGPAMPVAAASAGPMVAVSGAAAVSSSSRASSPAVAVAATGAGPDAEDMQIPPEGLDVCGVRRVPANELRRWKADPVFGKAQMQEIDEQTQRIGAAGLARISARLAAGNDRQQVAARLLMQDRDGAALLAERSTDPQAYQMALTACGGLGGGTPNCALLNPRRWAELDPTDARPWLRLMEAAHLRNDAVGVDAALAEAAVRTRLSRGSFLLEAQAAAVADVLPDAAALGHALVVVIGIDAAMPGLDVSAPLRVCKGDGLRDATRLRHCRALASQTLANATDITDAQIALKLAERAGVPREQQAHDAATLKAAQDRFVERAIQDFNVDCDSMRRLKRLSIERAASGELAMALALLPPLQPAR
ncbi:hypothetical protein [Roseateles sp.]|uniref:hypothetical protein n=1 Tax=Roseateles sp. TaxID=1971397 RepID=UPI003267E3FA